VAADSEDFVILHRFDSSRVWRTDRRIDWRTHTHRQTPRR